VTASGEQHGARRAIRDHCLGPGRAVDGSPRGARYGRLFPQLPPLVSDPEDLFRAGRPGGVCDAPFLPGPGGRPADDAQEAAGWPFFGQLIAHDITADRSPVGLTTDVEALRNRRSPRLDLEMVHAEGPVGSPYLYDVSDGAKFLIGDDGSDLARNSQGTALVGDPRNDVHVFVAQLHLAFLHAHNGLVDRLRDDGVPERDLFEEARSALVWHYQWVVVHDFLTRLVGRDVVDDVLKEPRFFAPPVGEAFIPLEFADAAYRYGHGQIRHRYRLRPDGPEYHLFPDLFGHGPVSAEHRVTWSQIFDMPGSPPAQRAKRLNGGLPASLIALPEAITGEVETADYRSLAVRDLMRGRATALPSGQAVAEVMGVPALTPEQVGVQWGGATPLWLYILKEAEHMGSGDRLGPVGGRIVAEVLIGLLRADRNSFLVADPGWRPTLPAEAEFGLADLLAFATQARER